ncbi:MAG: TIGR01777 family oxidoreductase [Thermoplasmataceae archaeon]
MEKAASTVSVFGATGLIGSSVIQALAKNGYFIRIFARDVEKSRRMFPDVGEHIVWDYTLDDWKEKLEGSAVVMNFSGAPIFQKWKGNYRREIWNSRVEATRQIVDALSRCKEKPAVLINGSASGIYGYDSFDDRDIDENTPPGKDFWGDLVTAWEKEALAAAGLGIRVVLIRTSVVLTMKGGALPQLASVFRKGIGGPISPGNQWFPWIHVDDEVGLVMFALENGNVSGPLNASDPQVPTMNEFAATLGEVMHRGSRVRIPITVIRLMMGEVANVLARGKKVIPRRAMELGYRFRFTDLKAALMDLMGSDS